MPATETNGKYAIVVSLPLNTDAVVLGVLILAPPVAVATAVTGLDTLLAPGTPLGPALISKIWVSVELKLVCAKEISLLAMDEGIAHDGCASTCGADAEDAGWRAIFKRDWASTGVGAGVKDELLHGNRDDRRGKGKIDGGGVVHQRAWNVSCSCSRVVLSSYLVEDCLGDLVG